MNKNIVFLATSRYSINIDDLYMFYRRTPHKIKAILYHYSVAYKKWWMDNYFVDPARNNLYDSIDFNKHKFIPWYDAESACKILEHLDFDYLCMGNGSGFDQQKIINHVGLEKCLFSEYGWLPWSDNFYLSRGGCGINSDITLMDETRLKIHNVNHEEITKLRGKYDNGNPLKEKDFIYVPLQKDLNDFKFNSSPFTNNENFLDFIHEIVPSELTVFVKPHPLYKKAYDFSKYGRFRDISNENFNKASLYRSMSAMVCINSTSILEAILFDANVFAYGYDIFCNKGLVNFRIMDPSEFRRLVDQKPDVDIGQKFISLLIQRQIDRKRCLRNDGQYINSHYWNRNL